VVVLIIPPSYVKPEHALKLSTQLHSTGYRYFQTKQQLLELVSVAVSVLYKKMAKCLILLILKAPLLYKNTDKMDRLG